VLVAGELMKSRVAVWEIIAEILPPHSGYSLRGADFYKQGTPYQNRQKSIKNPWF